MAKMALIQRELKRDKLVAKYAKKYAELGIHRLVVNLGSQRPEKVDQRAVEIEKLVKLAA